ncbi:MAG: hypothetical protein OEZ14_15740 [Acidimicrobiia bacterium]|nr:hypothetical protein [Acidimicrobiia bacterium]
MDKIEGSGHVIEARQYRADPSMDGNGNSDAARPDASDPIADLFRTIYPALRRYAAVVATPADDPDDLVQEAPSRVLTNAAWTEIRDPAAYMRRSIANLVIDRSRRQATRLGRGHLVAIDGDQTDVYPSDLAVIARTTGTVACAWIELWIEGRASGDAAAAGEAEAALSTARGWDGLVEIADQGGWSSVLWEYADAVNADGTVVGGKLLTVEESYQQALGCDLR